ncbi:hypothetical protein BH09MYX1_BH09MYX1_18030 [soil metagenome]
MQLCRVILRSASALIAVLLFVGCAHAPSSLDPAFSGSVGMTHRGVLDGGEELSKQGDGFRFLRDNGRHFATPRFARVIKRAAASVAAQRPGSTLVLGDISTREGGQLMPHFSHRAGRDADLIYYFTTEGGAPVAEHGFLHVGPDGLAFDESKKRFLRFDVEREWLLVRALLDDPEARVQWIFVHENVKAISLQWARARGESTETLWRAEQLMLQPNPGGPHDDHLHVRTACDQDEVDHGCVPFGPERPWLILPPRPPPTVTDDDLALGLFTGLPAIRLATSP